MKTGRNDPCPCGSGKKYKHCCYEKDQAEAAKAAAAAREAAAEAPAVDEDEESVAPDAHDKKKHHGDQRQRFQGLRGGSGGFKAPRTSRGSQRGN